MVLGRGVKACVGDQLAVVDVLVQVASLCRAVLDHRHLCQRDLALQGGLAVHARPLETRHVVDVEVGHIEGATHRVDHHVEQGVAHRGDGGLLKQGVGIDREHVLVRQGEGNSLAPVALELVFPLLARLVVLDDHAGLRGFLALHVGAGARLAARVGHAPDEAGLGGVEAIAHHLLVNGGGLVARLERGHIQRVLVRAHGQRTRRVRKETHDLGGDATEGCAQAVGVEHPDVGAANAGRGQLGVTGARHAGDGWVGAVLTAVSRGDEGLGRRAGKDHVTRLVAHQQGANHARGAVHSDDAHAVRQVVDHPQLAIGRHGHGHRLHAHRHARGQRQGAAIDVEHIERAVGRVDHEQLGAVGRLGHGAHMAAFKLVVRRGGSGDRLHGRLREHSGHSQCDRLNHGTQGAIGTLLTVRVGLEHGEVSSVRSDLVNFCTVTLRSPAGRRVQGRHQWTGFSAGTHPVQGGVVATKRI